MEKKKKQGLGILGKVVNILIPGKGWDPDPEMGLDRGKEADGRDG